MKNHFNKMRASASSNLKVDTSYLISGTLLSFLQQSLFALTGLVLALLYARVWSVEAFGEYTFYISILGFVSILSLPGMLPSLTIASSKGFDGDYNRVIKKRFHYSLLGSLVLILISLYFYSTGSIDRSLRVLLFALLFPLQVSLLGWHHFLVGKKLFKVLTKLLIFFYCFQILLQGLGVFAFKNQAVLMLVFSIILAFILNAICSFFAKKYVHNTKTSSETLTKGFTLTYSAVISSLIISGVHLAIGVFAGLESLALFYFGLKIAKLFHQVIKEIMKNVILPKASSFSIKELFSKQKLLTVTFAASVVVTAFLYIIFPYVLPPVLGENYLLSINYIQIIILSVPFWSISGLLLPFIYTNGKKSQIYIVENGPHIVSILALILFMLYKNVLILVYAELALGITFSIFASTIIYKIYKQQLTS